MAFDLSKNSRYTPNPLVLNGYWHWKKLCKRYGGVDAAHRLKALQISLGSLCWSPVRSAERMLFQRRIDRAPDHAPPVFIIGHWRSGTTHVHNLLSQDPRFSFLSTFQCVAPQMYLLSQRFLRPLMSASMPDRRPMDNMALGVDLPQEEEFAICMISPSSFYSAFSFPSHMSEMFDKFVMFDGISSEEVAEWKESYQGLLRKRAFTAPGQTLLLKNPVNTARISTLLELYPDAKFIHVVRNPYSILKSTERLFHATVQMLRLQAYDPESIQPFVLSSYEKMMKRYLEDVDSIPAGNLAEVRYEEVIQHPLDTARALYQDLRLGNWEDAEGPIRDYLGTIKNYEPNRLTLSPEDQALVESRWGFALEHWGYELP